MEFIFNNATIVLILCIVAAIISSSIFFLSRYKKCPPNQLLVIYGKTASNKTSKVIHGGGTFIWPIIQDYAFIDLTPRQISIKIKNVVTKLGVEANVSAIFNIGVSKEEAEREIAAERLLEFMITSNGDNQLDAMLTATLEGQTRGVLSGMTIEEINCDRNALYHNVMDNIEKELNKLGLSIFSMNIESLSDDKGYIAALGEKATAVVLNKSKADVAEQNRIGDTAKAEAERARNISVADANAKTNIGKAEAEAEQKIRTAELAAAAAAGENTAATRIAESNAQKEVSIVNANREVEISRIETQKKVQEASAEARRIELYNKEIIQEEIEKQRAEVQAQKTASVHVIETENNVKLLEMNIKAEAERNRIKAENEASILRISAEANANQIKTTAKAESDVIITRTDAEAGRITRINEAEAAAIFAKGKATAEAEAISISAVADAKAESTYKLMSAEAKGIKEQYDAKAEGFKNLVAACGNSDSAINLLMLDKVVELTSIASEAIKNIKIDSITILGNGNSNEKPVSSIMNDVASSLPAIHLIAEKAGIKLPSIFGEKKEV